MTRMTGVFMYLTNRIRWSKLQRAGYWMPPGCKDSNEIASITF